MRKNPFFVNMTVGIPDTPIPDSFYLTKSGCSWTAESFVQKGNDSNIVMHVNRPETSLCLNMTCRMRLKKYIARTPFPDHHGDSRPPSPAYSRDSLADVDTVHEQAHIYHFAMNRIANLFLDSYMTTTCDGTRLMNFFRQKTKKNFHEKKSTDDSNG